MQSGIHLNFFPRYRDGSGKTLIKGSGMEPIDESWNTDKYHMAIVVEDGSEWLDVVSNQLDAAGYIIRKCSRFGEALGFLTYGQYDLAIIDLELRQSDEFSENGFDTTYVGRKLIEKSCSLNIPTMVISNIQSPAIIESLFKEWNIFAYFEKDHFQSHVFCSALADLDIFRDRYRIMRSLSNREREVLDLIQKDLCNAEIASALVISPNTVKRHIKSILNKFQVNNRKEIIRLLK
jgi:DNA-binding CsgD family transcriptional regulator